MYTLILLVAGVAMLDYFTGILASAKCKKISSSNGLRGIFKKLALFCALALGFFLDYAIPSLIERGFSHEMTINLPFGLIIAGWVIINEAISVIENLAICGVKLPKAVICVLSAARDKIEKK